MSVCLASRMLGQLLEGVWIRWNGTVEWNGGMDWNGMDWNGME